MAALTGVEVHVNKARRKFMYNLNCDILRRRGTLKLNKSIFDMAA
jgi:hypothetical protein